MIFELQIFLRFDISENLLCRPLTNKCIPFPPCRSATVLSSSSPPLLHRCHCFISQRLLKARLHFSDLTMASEDYFQVVDSEAGTCDSDDSQEQPSFDILEETQSRFSNLSVQKNYESRVPAKGDGYLDCVEVATQKFDANDEKSFENVQKIIEGGRLEKLKVEQCKLYLRKHGLRLAGKKDILINRIKEHISIMNGEGERIYPASSFVMNCKGDACTGDVVMFEQNVYEMFSIASRSATGPPCGTRVVAGRIVKESYGAAKQQHTFTIEVLWSKGVKPLPPLHPLLIKGRNLYRLKTMRQRWEDESQRHKILSEKHVRGNAARSDRETRLQEKEKKRALRESRVSRGNIQNEKQENKRMASPTHVAMVNSRKNPAKRDTQNTQLQYEGINLPAPLNPYAGALSTCVFGNQPLMGMGMAHNLHSHKENIVFNSLRSLVIGNPNGPLRNAVQFTQNMGFCTSTQFERRDYDVRESFHRPWHPLQNYNFQQGSNNMGQGQRRQLCRYYAQGRCHYGTNCKYLH